jgi:hypothetical protein
MMELRRYSWPIHLGIFVLVVYGAGDLWTAVVAPLPIIGDHPPNVAMPAPQALWDGHPAEAYAVIHARHLFGRKEPATRGEAPDTPPPPTEPAGLLLRLAGTVVGSAGSTYAILEEASGRKQTLYHVGDRVQGAIVTEITRHRVVLARGDQREEFLSFQTVEDASPAEEVAAPTVRTLTP